MKYNITPGNPILVACLIMFFLGVSSNVLAQSDSAKGKPKKQTPKQRKKVDTSINYYMSDTVPRLVPLYENKSSSKVDPDQVDQSNFAVAMG